MSQDPLNRFHFLHVPLKCRKCGRVIQTNSWELDEKGNIKLDEKGRARYVPALIACQFCALAAKPPEPKKKRRQRGETDPNQMTIDVPPIKL